jgi:hypothetical protein
MRIEHWIFFENFFGPMRGEGRQKNNVDQAPDYAKAMGGIRAA